jgi:hypothetical protein
MRASDGSTGTARPTNSSIANRNPHRHKKEWKFIADQTEETYRYWYDFAPEIVTN